MDRGVAMDYALEIRHVGRSVFIKIYSILGSSPAEEEQKLFLVLDDIRDTEVGIGPTYLEGVLDHLSADQVEPGFEIVSGREELAAALAKHFRVLPHEEALEAAEGAILTLFEDQPFD